MSELEGRARAPRWGRAISVYLAAIGVFCSSAVARADTSVVLVRGAPDPESVWSTVDGELQRRWYTGLSRDEVAAAVEFTLEGQAPSSDTAERLRGALGATVLYLIDVRTGQDGAFTFAIERYAAAGRTARFGSVAADGLLEAIAERVRVLEREARETDRAQRPPPVAEVVDDARPPATATSAREDAAPPVERVMDRATRERLGELRRSEAVQVSAARATLGLVIISWAVTPLGGLMCAAHEGNDTCLVTTGLGFIPLAGPLLQGWAFPPQSGWGDEHAFFMTVAVVQMLTLVGVGAARFQLKSTRRDIEELLADHEVSATHPVMPAFDVALGRDRLVMSTGLRW